MTDKKSGFYILGKISVYIFLDIVKYFELEGCEGNFCHHIEDDEYRLNLTFVICKFLISNN